MWLWLKRDSRVQKPRGKRAAVAGNGGDQRWSGGTTISDWLRDRSLIGLSKLLLWTWYKMYKWVISVVPVQTAKNVNLKKSVYLQKFDLVGVSSLERVSGTVFFPLSSTVNMETRWNRMSFESCTEATAVNRVLPVAEPGSCKLLLLKLQQKVNPAWQKNQTNKQTSKNHKEATQEMSLKVCLLLKTEKQIFQQLVAQIWQLKTLQIMKVFGCCT